MQFSDIDFLTLFFGYFYSPSCVTNNAIFLQSHKCNCDELGTIDGSFGQCDVETGKCMCKKNVEGLNCSQCKPGTFFLDKGMWLNHIDVDRDKLEIKNLSSDA